ncbi:hypothetical protein ACVWYN_001027 [Pedobacter sp. UYP24]
MKTLKKQPILSGHVPNEDEQNKIYTIISKIQQEINFLKEYKATLISEVVIGKVDA